MKLTPIRLQIFLVFFMCIYGFSGRTQDLNTFKCIESGNPGKSAITESIQFNGYTNHWQDVYTKWVRYGNLFKMAIPSVQPTILQSKIDIAEDMGVPGLLMQEGFINHLFAKSYSKLKNPLESQLENELKKGNVLVILNSDSDLGKKLDKKAEDLFAWVSDMKSHQLDAANLKKIKAYVLENGDLKLFVISSSSPEQMDHLLNIIQETKEIVETYDLHKGWFGAATLLKSVTSSPGHPLEVISKGMNEGNSWFIFDGYMDFLAKDELENWINEVQLPVVANVGFSPIYGCSDYEGLQVQDMQTKQAWIDYAHKKGGYAFRPVYDPASDAFEFDGYIAQEGNKEQIDNENVPFISRTGGLIDNLTSSMVLFIEKGKSLNNNNLWDAIMNRREVAVLEKAVMMGPAKYRNALQLLYLDKYFLEEYFAENIDISAEVDGYNLIVTLKNYSKEKISGTLSLRTTSAINIQEELPLNIDLDNGETREIRISLNPQMDAMDRTNPVAVKYSWRNNEKETVAMLNLPPAISLNRLLYGHTPNIKFPVTIHNFTEQKNFPVEVKVYQKDKLDEPVFEASQTCEIPEAAFEEIIFNLQLKPGNYTVKVNSLGVSSEGQLGVGESKAKNYVYEMDLNSDGINEYRMENDSAQITLLRTGARIIEYIVKSRKDNVLFKIWPEKTYNHKRPFRMRGYYPYGGFEDFLGQASMETHKLYDAKIIKQEGDYVRVEMETDYFGNKLKKTFSLYGDSPLVEVRFELTFKNPEANVLGPQPILELGKNHGTEDVFIVPTFDGNKEYRMRPEEYYGQAINVREGWNAGYDLKEDVSFVGAFPVTQPLFLHMWMNHPDNQDAPHYYVEFQPWTPIIHQSNMYFTYYLWGSGGAWQKGLQELRKRNLITTRENIK